MRCGVVLEDRTPVRIFGDSSYFVRVGAATFLRLYINENNENMLGVGRTSGSNATDVDFQIMLFSVCLGV